LREKEEEEEEKEEGIYKIHSSLRYRAGVGAFSTWQQQVTATMVVCATLCSSSIPAPNVGQGKPRARSTPFFFFSS